MYCEGLFVPHAYPLFALAVIPVIPHALIPMPLASWDRIFRKVKSHNSGASPAQQSQNLLTASHSCSGFFFTSLPPSPSENTRNIAKKVENPQKIQRAPELQAPRPRRHQSRHKFSSETYNFLPTSCCTSSYLPGALLVLNIPINVRNSLFRNTYFSQ